MAIIIPEHFTEFCALSESLVRAIPAGSDWDADIAADARRLTEEAGWAWDFTTWQDAYDDYIAIAATMDNKQ